jgi:hypothetical protein
MLETDSLQFNEANLRAGKESTYEKEDKKENQVYDFCISHAAPPLITGVIVLLVRRELKVKHAG